MTKVIYLHGAHTDKFALCDDEDYADLIRYKWYLIDGYIVRYLTPKDRRNKECKHMHRHVLGLKVGDKTYVDHKNHLTHDNQKDNLRQCTGHQNGGNSKKTRGNTSSRFKGVGKRVGKRGCSWSASIIRYGKNKHLGTFDSEEKAALAYDKAAREIFKEFAYVNFPDIHDYSDVEEYMQKNKKDRS